MGYCMDMIHVSFLMDHNNKESALKAIKAIMTDEAIQKNGGVKDSSGWHYSWVHTSVALGAETLEEILDEWRWKAEVDELNGDIVKISFMGEKHGNDIVMFNAIAPYVYKGCYIQMTGEDSCVWRWIFDGEKCEEKIASFRE